MRTRREGASELEPDDEIEVADHDPRWKGLFLLESKILEGALGRLALEIHHIGSTAVPGLAAKPVIDIMVATNGISEVNGFSNRLAPLGYTNVPQDDPGRLYFRKGVPRTHHLHVVKAGSWIYHSYLWFRDYLMDHPATAEEYECLKWVLAKKFKSDRAAYVQGKEHMISMVLERASKERLIFPLGSV
jgi:GrpB-like predicted nucleotidyltransferase (UPF0157 family)